MTRRQKLKIFEGYGIEVEYMIVDRNTLDILSVSDELLKSIGGDGYTGEAVLGQVGISNEFFLHVIEMRNIRPISTISRLGKDYLECGRKVNHLLKSRGAMLMPTSMHPWMNPRKEPKLWTRTNRRVYETYHRVFGCMRHGWANIQSMQVNISFWGDKELKQLLAPIRVLLPLIPAIAASSPFTDGRFSGRLDNRLYHYARNQILIPSVTAKFIPEPVYTRKGYRTLIFKKMYDQMASHDRKGILRHEWLNSRGAIPRFDRSAIEIRSPDVQENPVADIAIARAVTEVLKKLVAEDWLDLNRLASWNTNRLATILNDTVCDAEHTLIEDAEYLHAFRFPARRARADEVWHYLIEESYSTVNTQDRKLLTILNLILRKGTLARRIMRAAGKRPSRALLVEIYRELCNCLAKGRFFDPG